MFLKRDDIGRLHWLSRSRKPTVYDGRLPYPYEPKPVIEVYAPRPRFAWHTDPMTLTQKALLLLVAAMVLLAFPFATDWQHLWSLLR